MNSLALLYSLISSSAIMNGNEDIPSLRKDYPHIKSRFLENKRNEPSPMIGTNKTRFKKHEICICVCSSENRTM